MEARATAKTIRVSPQKARLVVDLVRGKSVKEALGILEFTNKSATPAIIRLLTLLRLTLLIMKVQTKISYILRRFMLTKVQH